MIKSQVWGHNLSQIDSLNFMKMIFSSGDYFPGFYRFTLGTQKIGDESLSLNTLIWLYFEQKMTQNYHSKEDWLELQHEVYDRDIASEAARNAGNYPEVRDLFSKRMMDWYFNSKGYDIIYLDTNKKVDHIEKNRTYYFMGSLIHSSSRKLFIGYNKLKNESTIQLEISYEEVIDYLSSILTPQQITDLFLEADIVATLDFHDENAAKLNMQEKYFDEYLLKQSETKVFASPIEEEIYQYVMLNLLD